MDQGVIARVGTTWTLSKDQWVWHQGQWVQFLKPAKPTPQDMLCHFAVKVNEGTSWSFVAPFYAYLPNQRRRYMRTQPWHDLENYPGSLNYWVEGKYMTPVGYQDWSGQPGFGPMARVYDFGPFPQDELITAMVLPQIEHNPDPKGKGERGKPRP